MPLNSSSVVKESNKQEADLVSRKVEKTKIEIENLKLELQKLIKAGLNNQADSDNNVQLLQLEDKSLFSQQPCSKLNNDESKKQANEQTISKISNNLVSKQNLPANITTRYNYTSLRKYDISDHDNVKVECQQKRNGYDKQRAREYIKKQREKRAEQMKAKIKETQTEIEMRKKKLKELHEKSLQIITKNIQQKRERSRSREKFNKLAQNEQKTNDSIQTTENVSKVTICDEKVPTNKNAQVDIEKPKVPHLSSSHSESVLNTRSQTQKIVSPSKTQNNIRRLKMQKSDLNVKSKNLNSTKNSSELNMKSKNASDPKSLEPKLTLQTKDINFVTDIKNLEAPKIGLSKPEDKCLADSEDKAATKIQAYYRGFRQRKLYSSFRKSDKQNVTEENKQAVQHIETINQPVHTPFWLQTNTTLPYPYNFINAVKQKLCYVVQNRNTKLEEGNSSEKNNSSDQPSNMKEKQSSNLSTNYSKKNNSDSNTLSNLKEKDSLKLQSNYSKRGNSASGSLSNLEEKSSLKLLSNYSEKGNSESNKYSSLKAKDLSKLSKNKSLSLTDESSSKNCLISKSAELTSKERLKLNSNDFFNPQEESVEKLISATDNTKVSKNSTIHSENIPNERIFLKTADSQQLQKSNVKNKSTVHTEQNVHIKKENSKSALDLKSFLSHKCLDLNLQVIEPLVLKVPAYVKKDESDSDTSKNIPDISTESSIHSEKRPYSSDSDSVTNKTSDFKLEFDIRRYKKLRLRKPKIPCADNTIYALTSNIKSNADTINKHIGSHYDNVNGSDKQTSEEPSKSTCHKHLRSSGENHKQQFLGNDTIIAGNSSNDSQGKSSTLKTVFSDNEEFLRTGQEDENNEGESKPTSESNTLHSFINYVQSLKSDHKSSEITANAKTNLQFDELNNSHKLKECLSAENGKSTLSHKMSISEELDTRKNSETNVVENNEEEINSIKKKSRYSSDFSSLSTEENVPSLKRPSITLNTSHVSLHNTNKQVPQFLITDSLLKPEGQTILNTKVNSNEIHLKFEAEIRLLHNFNKSLQEVVEKERSLLENQFPNQTKPVYPHKQTVQPLRENILKEVKNNASAPTTNSSKIMTINYSRGSNTDGEEVPILDESTDIYNNSLLSTDFDLSNFKDTLNESHMQNSINVTTSASKDQNDTKMFTGLSLGMFEQLIRDEDSRIENLKTILKVREKALLDRTKSELAWLEIQKKHLRDSGQLNEISMIKKKQRGLLVKLQHERHEMQRLKQMQKAASRERKTLLRQQRNMIKAQLSTNKVLTKLKHKRERRSSGPLKVLSVQSCSESIISEASVSRRSSTAGEEIVSVISRSHSVISSHVTDVVPSQNNLEEQSWRVNVKDEQGKSENEQLKRSLLMRETALQKRRKAAEELLQWHQRLLEEERQIAELESAANLIISQVGHVTSDRILESKPKANYTFKGCQLNVMWQNMTGLQDKKFNDTELYIMSKEALEQFCKDARRYVNTGKNKEDSFEKRKIEIDNSVNGAMESILTELSNEEIREMKFNKHKAEENDESLGSLNSSYMDINSEITEKLTEGHNNENLHLNLKEDILVIPESVEEIPSNSYSGFSKESKFSLVKDFASEKMSENVPEFLCDRSAVSNSHNKKENATNNTNKSISSQVSLLSKELAVIDSQEKPFSSSHEIKTNRLQPTTETEEFQNLQTFADEFSYASHSISTVSPLNQSSTKKLIVESRLESTVSENDNCEVQSKISSLTNTNSSIVDESNEVNDRKCLSTETDLTVNIQIDESERTHNKSSKESVLIHTVPDVINKASNCDSQTVSNNISEITEKCTPTENALSVSKNSILMQEVPDIISKVSNYSSQKISSVISEERYPSTHHVSHEKSDILELATEKVENSSSCYNNSGSVQTFKEESLKEKVNNEHFANSHSKTPENIYSISNSIKDSATKASTTVSKKQLPTNNSVNNEYKSLLEEHIEEEEINAELSVADQNTDDYQISEQIIDKSGDDSTLKSDIHKEASKNSLNASEIIFNLPYVHQDVIYNLPAEDQFLQHSSSVDDLNTEKNIEELPSFSYGVIEEYYTNEMDSVTEINDNLEEKGESRSSINEGIHTHKKEENISESIQENKTQEDLKIGTQNELFSEEISKQLQSISEINEEIENSLKSTARKRLDDQKFQNVFEKEYFTSSTSEKLPYSPKTDKSETKQCYSFSSLEKGHSSPVLISNKNKANDNSESIPINTYTNLNYSRQSTEQTLENGSLTEQNRNETDSIISESLTVNHIESKDGNSFTLNKNINISECVGSPKTAHINSENINSNTLNENIVSELIKSEIQDVPSIQKDTSKLESDIFEIMSNKSQTSINTGISNYTEDFCNESIISSNSQQFGIAEKSIDKAEHKNVEIDNDSENMKSTQEKESQVEEKKEENDRSIQNSESEESNTNYSKSNNISEDASYIEPSNRNSIETELENLNDTNTNKDSNRSDHSSQICLNKTETDHIKGVDVEVKKHLETLTDLQSPQSISSPRLQDVYTITTYDGASPVLSTDSDASLLDRQILSRHLFTSAEEEELVKKQLAIEQEIKQIEQQQKEQLPYLYLREIPNKPPPPYTPPTPAPTIPSVLPTSADQVGQITHLITDHLYNAYLQKNLSNVVLPQNIKKQLQNQIKPQCQQFIFDLCKELTFEHYQQFEEQSGPSWMQIKKKPKLAFEKPLDRKGLEKFLTKKVKELLGYEKVMRKESMIIKWSRKKRDHVDELLVLESQAEEAEWTNYDKDELIVINELTNEIINSLIEETAQILQNILAKKDRRE